MTGHPEPWRSHHVLWLEPTKQIIRRKKHASKVYFVWMQSSKLCRHMTTNIHIDWLVNLSVCGYVKFVFLIYRPTRRKSSRWTSRFWHRYVLQSELSSWSRPYEPLGVCRFYPQVLGLTTNSDRKITDNVMSGYNGRYRAPNGVTYIPGIKMCTGTVFTSTYSYWYKQYSGKQNINTRYIRVPM